MGVKVKKKGGAFAKGAETKATKMSKLLDLLAAKEAEAEAVLKHPVFDQIKELKEQIEFLAMQDVPEDESIKYEGVSSGMGVKLGVVPARRRVSDMGKLLGFMGRETFLANCSMAFKVIDDYLTPAEKDQCIETTRSGNRTVKYERRNT